MALSLPKEYDSAACWDGSTQDDRSFTNPFESVFLYNVYVTAPFAEMLSLSVSQSLGQSVSHSAIKQITGSGSNQVIRPSVRTVKEVGEVARSNKPMLSHLSHRSIHMKNVT